MDKIAEQKNRRRTLSAQNQYDENFNGGYSPEELEEAALIEREIQNIPDMPEWEPTEEKFQKWVRGPFQNAKAIPNA